MQNAFSSRLALSNRLAAKRSSHLLLYALSKPHMTIPCGTTLWSKRWVVITPRPCPQPRPHQLSHSCSTDIISERQAYFYAQGAASA